jgi:glucose/arabinose dehydrogenase
VTSGNPGNITVLKDGATPADPMSLVGQVQFAFPADAQHRTYSLAAQPIANGHNIYFNVGSALNDQATANPVGVSGLLSGSVNADSIYRFSITGSGNSPTIGNLQQIASGLRNAAGMAFHANGDFYFEDNGIDGAGNASFSADELNRISAADLGNSVQNFGFPNRYVDYGTGQPVGTGGIDPLVAFMPIEGRKSEGAAQIAFAPTAFPDGVKDGVFVGFHGKFNAAGASNDENALIFYDLSTDIYFDVVLPGSEGIGHFDGLLSTADSLYVADLNSNGSTGDTAPAGVIYQITAIPEPLALGLLGVLPLLARRRR